MKSIPFFKVCKLLDDLDAIFCRTIPLLPQTRIQKVGDAWIDWFRSNRDTLDAMHKDDVSVLFTLKPEILEDRDYNIYDETKFERFLARALCMGVNERKRYAKSVEEFNGGRTYLAVPSKTGLGLDEIVRNDIGYRVERIMKETGRDEVSISLGGENMPPELSVKRLLIQLCKVSRKDFDLSLTFTLQSFTNVPNRPQIFFTRKLLWKKSRIL